MYKACIVGREGTTGLRIDERLQTHPNVEILPIPEELRKDVPTIMKVAKEADAGSSIEKYGCSVPRNMDGD